MCFASWPFLETSRLICELPVTLLTNSFLDEVHQSQALCVFILTGVSWGMKEVSLFPPPSYYWGISSKSLDVTVEKAKAVNMSWKEGLWRLGIDIWGWPSSFFSIVNNIGWHTTITSCCNHYCAGAMPIIVTPKAASTCTHLLSPSRPLSTGCSPSKVLL